MANGKVVAAVHREGIHKMSITERTALVAELNGLKEQLGETAPRKPGRPGEMADPLEQRSERLQNRPALLVRRRRVEELLNRDDDLVAVGDKQRAILSEEAKELEGRLSKHMLTERERKYRMGQRPQDFETAVQKTVYQQKSYLPELQRWQEIMRQLYPDDPDMCDVRRIKAS